MIPPRPVCLVAALAALVLSGAPDVEAGLKRVPVDGKTKVVSPQKLTHKKFKTKKAKALNAKKSKIGNATMQEPVIVQPVIATDVLPNQQPQPVEIAIAPDAPQLPPATVPAAKKNKASSAPAQSPKATAVSKAKVYDVSASSPEQVEISKAKKTKKKRSDTTSLPPSPPSAN